MIRALSTFGIAVFLLSMEGCKPAAKQVESQNQPKAEHNVIIYYKLPPAWVKPDNSSDNLTIDDLKKAGVEFGDGAHVMTGGPTGFGMRNTLRNHEKLKAFFDKKYGKEWHEYKAPD